MTDGERKGLLWIGVLLAVLVVGGGLVWWSARPPEPTSFYDLPDEVPSAPGKIIRFEPFTRDVPEGARSWRILYTTTRADGTPTVASGLVATAQKKEAPSHLLAWSHGTTGVARGCAPSLLKHPFAGIPDFAPAIDAGWVVVATDYVGLGGPGPHVYLGGPDEAHAVLDSIRAVKDFDEVTTAGDPIVWGHSQGGHSGLFTGETAKSYAPEIHLAGVGVLAPATHLGLLFKAAEGSKAGKILTGMTATSWHRVYPQLRGKKMFRTGSGTLSKDIASRCLTTPQVLASVAETLALPKNILAFDPLTDKTFAPILDQNSPSGTVGAPMFIGQGLTDQVVDPKATVLYVGERCAAGERVEFHTYPKIDHFQIVEKGSPALKPLLTWTADRFDGKPIVNNCPK